MKSVLISIQPQHGANLCKEKEAEIAAEVSKNE